jgi:protein deglycase
MGKRAVVFLAEGFEEIEAVTQIDVLRRAKIDVTVVGIGSTSIKGARGIIVQADIKIDQLDYTPDVAIFPGGMPGAENLASSCEVRNLIRDMDEQGKLIAAICAAPAVLLAPLGILAGKTATCYPGMESTFSTNVSYSEETVVQDGNLITSQGVGTALEFALTILANLAGKDVAEMIGQKMLA